MDDKIVYFREQRKKMEKLREIEPSRISKTNSTYSRVGSHAKIGQNKEKSFKNSKSFFNRK